MFFRGLSRARMLRRALAQLLITTIVAAFFAFGVGISPAQAVDRSFTTRFTTNTEGDIVFVGNTLMNCPVGCTLANNANMVYVDADGGPASPLHGGGTVTTFNSSSADLVLPAGATVLWAGLYWAGNTAAGSQMPSGSGGASAPTVAARNQMLFRAPWMTGYQTITASQIDEDFTVATGAAAATHPAFSSFANVTALVNTVPPTGTSTFWGANVQIGTGTSGLGDFGGWSLVIVTSDATKPLRNLSVFDGWDKAENTTDVDVKFGPFVSPATGPITAKYGFIALDGDPGIVGDAVTVGAGTSLATATCSDTNPTVSNGLNPADNVFNSSITNNNANVATRNPNQTPTWGYDADFLNGTGLTNGSSYGCFRFKTNGDTYWPTTLATVIDLPSPDVTATKTAEDINGGLLNPGDIVEYTITMTNNGNDRAINLQLTDPIPSQLTYAPGTIEITAGPNLGVKTDAVDTDVADFTSNTVNVNLGTGATATSGGMLASGASTTVKFRTTLNTGVPGGTQITNTATVTYRGETLPTITLAPIASNVSANVAVQVDLLVTKDDLQTQAVAGSPISYTIRVRNNGPQTATLASVTDTIPALILSPTWTCSVAGQSSTAACGSATGSGNINTTVTLAINDEATFVVSGTVDPAASTGTGTLSNTASAAPAPGVTDTNPANNSDDDVDDIVRRADIQVTKADGSATASIPGTAVTYTVTVHNAGPSNAGVVDLVDNVPAAITGVSWTCSATPGSSCTAASGTGNAIATSATLLASGTATYIVSGTLDPATPAGTGTLVNTATATAQGGLPDPDGTNNSRTDTNDVTPRANLAINKDDFATTVTAGATVTYTIVVTNAGPSTAVNAVVSDTVPAAITGVSWTCTPNGAGAACGNASGTGNTISTTATIPVGTNVTYSVTGTLNPATPSGTNTLVNTATVAAPAGTTDPAPANNTEGDTNSVASTVDIQVTKTDGQSNAVPGEAISYDVVVTNAGTSSLVNGAFSDTVPAAITGVAWTCAITSPGTGAGAGTGSCATASGTGNTISTNLTLPPGAVATFTVDGTLDPATPAGTNTLVNTAAQAVPAGTTDSAPGDNAGGDTDSVTPRVDLSVTKDDGAASSVPGQAITYTIVVNNTGPSQATGAAFADTVPAAITGVTWTCTPAGAGASCATPGGSGNTIATNLTLPPNTSATFIVNGTLDASTPVGTGTLTNTATITAPAGTTDTNPGNNTESDVNDVTPQANLVVDKVSSHATRQPGEALTYTITVRNDGPSAVTGATFTDTVPASLTGVTWTCATTAGGSCASANGTGNGITNVLNLPVSGVATIIVDATVAASFPGGTITNTATVTLPAGTTDPVLGDNSDSVPVTVGITADLEIVKSNGSGTMVPGMQDTYTIVVTNNGPAIVTGALVADTFPAALTAVTWTCTATSPNACAAANGSGNIATTVDLAVSGTVTFVVTGTVVSSATGSISNTATVTAPSGVTDPTPGNNSSTDIDTLAPTGDLSIAKDNGTTSVVPGSVVNYTIIVSNAGPSDVTNAAVTDTFPVSLIGATWTCSATAGSSCAAVSGSGSINSAVSLTVTGSATYLVTGMVAPGATGTLANTAVVTPPSGFPDANPLNNSSTDSDPLTPEGDLSITKDDSVTNVVPGTGVTYTIVASNSGPSTVVSAPITDTLPSALVGATWTCTASAGSSCADASGSGSIASSVTLLPSGTATYVVTATVSPTATGSLSNTATIAAPSGFTDTVGGNNSDTDIDTLTPTGNLSITKSDGITNAIPGTAISYTVTVANSGPSTAVAAAITDNVPAAITGVTWSCTPTGAGASCASAGGSGNAISTSVTLPANTSAQFVISGTLAPTTPAGTLANTATVSAPSSFTDTNPLDNSAIDNDTIVPTGNLTISKDDSTATAVPGSSTVYTVVVSNVGPSTVTDAVVADALPTGATAMSWTCGASAGSSCTAASGTGALSTTVTLAAGGTATFAVTVAISPTATGSLVNTATVTAPAGFTETSTGDNSAQDTNTLTPQVDLAIDKNDGITNAVPGTQITYTISVSNSGPSTATAAAIADTVPAALTGVSWTCTPTGSGAACGSASGTGNTIATTVTLPPSSSATYTVIGTLNPTAAAGTLTNTATITAPAGATDTNTANNSDDDVDTITPEADLTVDKQSAGSMIAGEAIAYTITITNAGPSTATNASIVDTLPAGVLGATWLCNATSSSSCAAANGSGSIATTVTLIAGGSATFTVNGTIDPAFTGTLSNTATATLAAGATDPTPGDNTDTVNDPITTVSDISVSKSRVGTLVAGSPVTYIVTVSNAGPSTATNATLSDPIPAGVASWSWTCTATVGSSCGSASGTSSINTTQTLAPGGSAEYTITAQIAANATGSVAQLANVATANPSDDPDTSDNSAGDTGTIAINVDLSVVKTDDTTVEVAGTTVAYTITVSNAGPSRAVNAPVTDFLPTTLTSASWTCNATAGGSCAAASGTGSINSTVTLNPGASATYALTATIRPDAPLGTGTLVNTATVAAPSGAVELAPGNNSSTDVNDLGGSADLVVSKTDSSLTATAGAPISYTITVNNVGPSDVTNATISDTVPAEITGPSWSCTGANGGVCDQGSGSGSIATTADLPVGASVTYILTGVVSPTASGTLTNTASAATPSGVTDPNGTNNSSQDVDTIVASADLSITKTDGAVASTPGQAITYTIVASNAGPSSVTGATVTDTIPAALTSATWTCVAAGGATCTAAGSGNIGDTIDLPVGGSATYTLNATISSSATGSIANTATISSSATDPNTLNNSETDTNSLAPQADLSIVKDDGITIATPGSSVSYTITATNAGPSNAPGSIITDTVPAALLAPTWTCLASGGATCSAPSGSGNLNETVNLPAGGSVVYTLNGTVSPTASGTLSNTATITPPGTLADPTPGNNSSTDNDSLTAQADLRITKTDGATNEVPGTSISYTITATNVGPSAVTGATVTDTLPAALTGATWTCVAAGGATCAASGSGNINDTIDLPAGGSAVYTLNATISPTATGSLSNTASISSSVTDPTPGNNSQTDVDTLNAEADLEITKTDGATTEIPGTGISYTITATNPGPSAVTGATVTDTLPAALTGATWTCVAAGGATCAASGSGNISDTIDLPVGGSAVYTLNATISPSAIGTLSNTASIAAPSGVNDPTPGNNSRTDVDTLDPTADLRITKTDGATNEIPGTAITYTIVASNAGPSAVTGATITDTLPTSLSGASWTCLAAGGATCAANGSGDITDTINLPVGGTATYTLNATISPTATGSLSNTASIAAPSSVTDPTLGNNAQTDVDTLNAEANLAITKTDGVTTETPGTGIVYTIVASNAGPSAVTGATISDTLPASLTGATWTCLAAGGATCTAVGSGNISDTINIPVGGTATYTLSATISPSATGTLSNTATITAPAGVTDPTTGNNSETDVDTLNTEANLAITKTDGSATEIPGTNVTYTITASNAGPGAIVGATVSDTLPASLSGATWTCVAAGGATCTATGSGNINDTINLPVGGTAVYTLTANISPTATGTLSNTASITTPLGVTDPTPGNNSQTDVDTLNTTAELRITKTDGSATEIPGTSVTYTITATNDGPSAVVGATVADTLPASLTAAAWTCVASGGATCTTPGAGNINDTVNLPVGGTVEYTLTATILSTATGTLSNTATIAAPSGVTDPTPGNNSATDNDTLNPQADLRITKTDGATNETPGTAISYTITATNDGPSAVTGATITDTIPTTLTGATWTCVASGGATCTAAGSGDITDTVNLPAGSSVEYTLNATISGTASGTLTNTATITAPAGVTDPNPGNNSQTDINTLNPEADLTVTKTDGATTEIPGTSISYTITVTNAGPSTVNGATVSDNPPVALTGVSWTCVGANGGTCAAAGSNAINDTVNLPNGASVTYTLNATIAASATGSLTNSATVTMPVGIADPNGGDNTAVDVNTLVPTAELRITKTDGATTEIPGTPVTYTITAFNDGPSLVTGVSITDTLPSSLTGATWTCVAAGGATCTAIGTGNINDTITLPANSSAAYTLIASISPSATGTLSNTASITTPAGVTDPTPGNNAQTDVDTLNATAELRITKTDGAATEIPGTTVIYTITATNDGPSTVIGATISDTLPTSLTGATWTCLATGGATCTAAGSGNINDTINLPVGATATYTLTATISSTATGTLSNTATITAPAGVTDPTPGNNTAIDNDTLTPEADLRITKTDGATNETPGTAISYTITATNDGPSAVTGATITDNLPAALTGATWTCLATGGATCTATGSANINDTINLPAGSSVVYTLNATISGTASGTLTNTATIAAPAGVTDPNPGNNSQTDNNTLNPEANLTITKTNGVTSLIPGTTTNYTITVTNAGPSTVNGATVSDSVPGSLLAATWTCTAAGGAICTASGSGNINDTITIPVGGSVMYTLNGTVSPSATGSIVNTAAVALPAGISDPDTSDNTATDNDPLTPQANLAITKTDSALTEIPGTSISYTITATNAGPSAVTGATISDTLPTTLTGATWTCIAAGGATCTAIGSGNISDTINIPVGGTATYTLNATIAPNATGSLSNTASIAAPTGVTDPTPGNNTATDNNTLNPEADLQISKTDSAVTEIPGTSISYTISARNNGPSAATGATINDTLPAALTGATWTCVASVGATCTAAGSGNISDTINLPVGGTATYTLNATIAPNAAGTLTNTATIATPAGVTETNNTNNTAIDNNTLNPEADAVVTKTDGRTNAVPGTAIVYTLTASNAGPSNITGAVFSDGLPAALTGVTWSCTASGGATCPVAGIGNISELINLPVGSSTTWTVNATVSPSATGTLSNTASLALPSSVTDPNTTNNSATDIDTLLPEADLRITKTNSVTTLVPGLPTSYTIVATNAGPSNVSAAAISDTLPTTLTGASWSCVAAGGATCTPTGVDNITDTINLPVGGTATYTLTATVSPQATGTLANTATIATPAGVADPTPLNNSGTDADPLTPRADLSITKTDSSTTEIPGTAISYTITATNNGPSAVTGAAITDTVPAALIGATWTCIASGGATCTAAGSGSISDTVNIPVGGIARYTLNATIAANATGTLSNTARIAAPAGVTDPTLANNNETDVDTLLPEADLQITKTDSALTEIPGTTVRYTISARNNGPSAVTGAAVTDSIPSALTGATWTCVPAGGATCASNGTGNITDTINLPVNGFVTYTLDATITPGATGLLTNQATIATPTGVTEADNTNNTAIDTDTLVPTADAQVTKTDGRVNAVPGTPITYVITASNPGPSNIVGGSITDALPVELLATTWTCTTTGGASCTAGGSGNISDTVNLPAGSSITYTATGTVSDTATGTMSNTALLTLPGGITDPNPGNNSQTDIDTLLPEADVVIAKTNNASTVVPGMSTTYTITVTNRGPSRANGVVVNDTIPSSLTNATWTCSTTGGATCATSGGGTGNIADTVNLPINATVTYTLTADVAPTALGTLTNTATVTLPTTVADPDPLNNTARDSDPLTPRVDLTVTKTDSALTAVPGTTTSYTMTVRNSGPSAVTGATITDVLPATLTNATWTCIASAGATCSTAGTGGITDVANLGVNASITYTLNATIRSSATGTLTNTVSVAVPAGVTDTNPTDNSAQDTTTLTPRADLSITKTDNAALATPGEAITYTIRVANAGPSDVIGATVADTPPAALASVTWICAAAAGASCTTAGSGSINDTVNMTAGSSVTYTMRATIDPSATGTLRNDALVSAPAGTVDPNPANDEAADTNTLEPKADLRVTKISSGAFAGESITYTIAVTNDGPSSAPGVQISDTLPSALRNATWSCSATGAGVCTGPTSGSGDVATTATIPVGATITITVNATLAPSASGTLANMASALLPPTVLDPTPGATPGLTTGDVFETIRRRADLAITKTDNSTIIVPGRPTRYVIEAINNGPADVAGAQIVDDLSDLVVNATWTCAALSVGATCVTPSGTGDVAATVDLAVGASVRLVIDASVDPSTPAGPFVNTVTIDGGADVVDPTPSNNIATDSDTIATPRVDVSLTKTNAITEVVPGEATSYTITVRNAGPSTAARTRITDDVSALMTNVSWTCTSSAPGGCASTSGTGNIDTTVTLRPSATAMFTINGTVRPELRGTLVNTATATPAADTVDEDTTNDSASDSDRLTPRIALSVTKTDNATERAPGTPITYVITVSNAGPSTATGVQVTDVLPAPIRNARWTCTGSAGTSCGSTAGTGSLATSGGVIPPNGSITFRIDATTDPAARGLMVNRVSVAGTEEEPVTSDNIAVDDTRLIPRTDIIVTKTDSATERTPGLPTTYTITVRNAGPSSADGVQVRDELPASLLDATWTCEGSAGARCATTTGSGSIDAAVDLPFDAIATFTVRATVDPRARGVLKNTATATVSGDVFETDPTSNTATDESTLVARADLRITKTNQLDRITAGRPTTYTIVVTNAGPSAVVAGTVTDIVPVELLNPDWSCMPSSGASCGAVGVATSMTDTVDIPVNGSLTYKVTATVDPKAKGTITNTATIAAGDIVDTNPGDETASDTDPVLLEADLSITKTNNTEVLVPGKDTTYTIVVANRGPSGSGPVKVQDTLPKGLVDGTWTCEAGKDATCPKEGAGDLDATVELAADTALTFTVKARVIGEVRGEITNTASIVIPENVIDENTDDNTASDTDRLEPETDLTIAKTHTGELVAGSPISYTIIVSNSGPSTAIGAKVLDQLAATLVDATWTCADALGGLCVVKSGTGNVDVLVDLLAGASVTITVNATVSPDAESTLTNTATVDVATGENDPKLENNTSTDKAKVIRRADLVITKTDGREWAVRGRENVYTITVTNRGPATARRARVRDIVPKEYSNVTWTCEPTGDLTGKASCSAAAGSDDVDVLVDVPVGGEITIEVVGRLSTKALADIVNTTTVEMTDDTEELDLESNSASDRDVVWKEWLKNPPKRTTRSAKLAPPPAVEVQGGEEEPMPEPSMELAFTGSGAISMAQLAFSLLLFGAFLAFLGRRRRDDATDAPASPTAI